MLKVNVLIFGIEEFKDAGNIPFLKEFCLILGYWCVLVSTGSNKIYDR